jgi:hypothetical protein
MHARPTWPVLGLLLNALVWGLSWWPLREMQALGLHPLWSSGLIFGLALVVLSFWKPAAWQQLLNTPALWTLMIAASRFLRCVQNHSIWSAYTLGMATSTVSGRFKMTFRSGVGPHSAITASQTSSENSTSVAEKLSGEYSNRMSDPAKIGRRSLIQRVPLRAISTICGFSRPNTIRRWAGEVEL